MTDDQRARLESLVFSVPHPAQSLDARLEPYVALIAEIERTAIEAEYAAERGPSSPEIDARRTEALTRIAGIRWAFMPLEFLEYVVAFLDGDAPD